MPGESIKLISSMATRDVLADLVAQYQHSTGRQVVAEAAGGVDVARRVQGGEPVDVVVLASSAVDQLIQDRKLLIGSRVDLVKSGISVAVREGAERLDVSTEDAVRQAVLGARTISYSTGPSGVYLMQLFERWGVAETIRLRLVQAPPGVSVGLLVARGEVALGFQQLSELINLQGISILGPLPAAVQSITTFSAGVSASSQDAPAARQLIAFMADPAAADAKRKQGMEPA